MTSMSVAFVKIGVSLPEDLIGFAEKEAAFQGHENRSRTIADALRFYREVKRKASEHQRRAKDKIKKAASK